MPRPYVAARRESPADARSRSETTTLGSPAPKGSHESPPSAEVNTPMSVPANRVTGVPGRTARALTGMSGRLAVRSAQVQVAPPSALLPRATCAGVAGVADANPAKETKTVFASPG